MGGNKLPVGNLAAVKQMFENFHKENYRKIIKNFTNIYKNIDNSLIEDVYMSVFISMYQKSIADCETFPENIYGFFRKSMNHKIIDIYRHNRKYEYTDITDDSFSSEESYEGIGNDQSIPGDEIVHWKKLLHSIFDCLPETSQIVAQRIFQGETAADLQQIYNKNGHRLIFTVRQQICRCLSKLQHKGNQQAGVLSERFCP